jgi:hypothetical protein
MPSSGVVVIVFGEVVGFIAGLLLVVKVVDRLLMIGARRCEATVVSAWAQDTVTTASPYVRFTEYRCVIAYTDHQGRRRTFTHHGRLPAGGRVVVAHRRQRPFLARVLRESGVDLADGREPEGDDPSTPSSED